MEMVNNNMDSSGSSSSSSSDNGAGGAGGGEANAPPKVAHSLEDSENSVVLQDELFLDADLYGIFDDGDGDALVEFDPSIVMEQHQVENSSNMQQASSREQHPDQQRPKRRKVKDGSPSEITRKTGKTKRRSSKLEGENRGLPPPGWHSEAADKQHRQEMILEIARLLQARKKVVPSDEWLRQLPHKARKLEGRLYRTAPSLESYLDSKTLKLRLKRLARAIVRQYGESKRSSFMSSDSTVRTSITSNSSVPYSTRDSIVSTDSLRTLRDSMTGKSSISSGGRTDSSLGQERNAPSDQTMDQAREPVSAAGTSRLESSAENHSAGRAGAPPSSLSQEQKQQLMFQQQQQFLMNSALSRQSLQNHPMSTASSSVLQASASSGLSVQSTMPTNPSNGTTSDISELERQKAVNARLQQQIFENIRRQEELVRRLQASSQASDSSLQQQQQQQQSQGAAHMGNAGNPSNPNLAASMQQNTMTPNASQYRFQPNNLAMPGAVSSNPANPGLAILNNSMNLHQPQHQQHQIFNLQQAANMGSIMGFGNSSMMAQAFGSQPTAVQNTLIQQNNLIQQQALDMFRASMLRNNGHNAQMPVSSMQAMQLQQQQQQGLQRNTSAGSAHSSNHGSINNNTRNSMVVDTSAQGSATGQSPSAENSHAAERRTSNAASNSGGRVAEDSPLSPNSFRW